MNPKLTTTPVVMAFSGHDPSGGAGIQADIETLASIGCHCSSIITAITAQDTIDVKDIFATDSTLLIEQARAILEDMPVAAFKMGMLGSVENIEIIHTLLMDYPDIPVVLDPIINAGGGTQLATDTMVDAMKTLILPLTTVITPNYLETQLLTPSADTIEASVHALYENGCQYILVTGSHARTKDVINTLYFDNNEINSYQFERLPNHYHGSGCTLASAIAGYIAHGMDINEAIDQAQQFTFQTLKHARALGMGQHIPNRLYWSQK